MVSGIAGALGGGGASLGRSVLTLSTDDRKYNKGLDQAEDKARRFGRASKIAVGVAAAGFAALAAGAAASVRSFAQAGDEVQKMAQRTGFSTEALSELRHAAELSGTSLAGLETGVRRMQRTVFDAGQGLAEAERALEQLGLTAAELEGLAPEQQFDRITTALAGVANESNRAALAQIVFGRSGTALLPMLSDGAEGLAAMKQEAHDLGIVFDQEAADKAAEFNDTMTRLGASVQALQFSVARGAIPVLEQLAHTTTGLVSGFNDLPGPLKQATLLVASLAVVGPGAAIVLTRIASAAVGARVAILSLNLAVLASPLGLAAVGVSLLAGAFLMKRYGDATSEAATAQRELTLAGEAARIAEGATAEGLERRIGAQARIIGHYEEEKRAIEDAIHIKERDRIAEHERNEELERLDELITAATFDLDALTAAQGLQADAAEEAAKRLEEQRQAMEATRKQADELARSLRDVSAQSLATALAAEIAMVAAEDGNLKNAFDQALSELRPVLEQEQEIADIVAVLFDMLTPSVEEAADGTEKFSSSVDDATDSVDELNRLIEEEVRLRQQANQTLFDRARQNAMNLINAAIAHPGAVTPGLINAIDEQNRIAGDAAGRLVAGDPTNPANMSTGDLINYGTLVVQTPDLEASGLPDVAEVLN